MVGGTTAEAGRGAISPTVTSSVVSTSEIDSFSVTVSGADIESSTQSFSGGTTTLELEVSPGERIFTVAGTITDPESFVTEVTGQTTAQVTAGETTRVTINLDEITDSRILFADGANQRVVMFDDMQGSQWRELYPGVDVFGYTYDVDYDSQGRIYVATDNGLFRFDDMDGTNLVELTEDIPTSTLNLSDGGLWGVSVDRNGGRVYVLHEDQGVFRGPVNSSEPWASTELTSYSSNTSGASAIVTLPEGQVVVGGTGGGGILDPATGTIDSYFYSEAGVVTQDLLYWDGEIWEVVERNQGTGPVLRRLDPDSDMSTISTGATIDDFDQGVDPDEYLGPSHFSPRVRDSVYLADVDYVEPQQIDSARVVSLDPSDGSQRTTFGGTDSYNEADEQEEDGSDADEGLFLFNEPLQPMAGPFPPQ